MKKKEKIRKGGKKKGSLSTIILVVILLIGLSVMLYPTVSDYWNSFHQTRAIANYDAVVAELDETDYEALFEAAESYNEQLRGLSTPFSECEQLSGTYNSVLDVAGNGIIGYISISKIGVELPIYHGTSDAVLNVAAGHLEGSSLPIGGESRHSVLSAHRGLPSAKLFTDLDRLEVTDTFTITVLNQIMTYEVDQILIVEPTQMEALNVTQGMDYCTLLTCTPYGINSHRLLVRAHRIENAQGAIVIHKEATKIPPYIAAPAIAIPMLFVLLLISLFAYRKKPLRVSTQDVVELSKTLQDSPGKTGESKKLQEPKKQTDTETDLNQKQEE
jgi:sortase A